MYGQVDLEKARKYLVGIRSIQQGLYKRRNGLSADIRLKRKDLKRKKRIREDLDKCIGKISSTLLDIFNDPFSEERHPDILR